MTAPAAPRPAPAATTITGASDDLIELDGQIREEFNYYTRNEEGGALLAFSDGTLLSIKYDNDGIWRIARLAAGKCEYAHQSGDVVEDTFDVVTLTGDLAWCVLADRGQYNPAFATTPPVAAAADEPGAAR